MGLCCPYPPRGLQEASELQTLMVFFADPYHLFSKKFLCVKLSDVSWNSGD